MKRITKLEIMKIISCGLILVLALLLFSCGSPGEKQTTYNFKQGYGGLQLSFLENAPPEKIYPNSEFKLIVKLDNQAAYDLINGKVRIVGLDDRYFQIKLPGFEVDNSQCPYETYIDASEYKKIISIPQCQMNEYTL